MVRKTRKQHGGVTAENKKRISSFLAEQETQIVHCLSQLKRFSPCIKDQPIRGYQFFYNLGRLQELLGETKHPEIWWKPIETLLSENKYDELSAHVDTLKDLIGLEYDASVVAKGC